MKKIKKNQVIITALAIMIAVAGYINYTGNLSDIISGKKVGRETESEFNYFNSIGLSFVDVAVANYCYKAVTSKGLGTDWSLQESDAFDVLKDLDFNK